MTVRNAIRIVLSLLAIALLVLIIYYLRNLWYYLLSSAMLAFIGRPLVDLFLKIRLGQKHIPASVAAAIVVLLMFAAFLGLVGGLLPLLINELQIWAELDTASMLRYLEEQVNAYTSFAKAYQIEFNTEILKQKLLSSLQLDNFTGAINALAGGLGSLLIGLFSIVFITFFFLKERNLAPSMLYALFDEQHHAKLDILIPKVKHLLSRYFIGLGVQVSLIAFLLAVGLKWFAGLENVLLIAVFAGIINIIPYIGPIIGAVVGLTLGLAQNMNIPFQEELMPLLFSMALVFAVVQLIDNFVFQPFIFSNSVNAHPLEIFLVITAAGTLVGVGGMIVAVPVYSLFRIIAKVFFSEFPIVKNWVKNA